MIDYAARLKIPDILPENHLNGLYRGIVVDIDDPLYRGRVRIRVFGVHTGKIEKEEFEGIPNDELPWAEQVAPIMGGTSGFGAFGVPTVNSIVGCFFLEGDPLHPAYFGTQMGMTSSGGGGGNGGGGGSGEQVEDAAQEQPREPDPFDEETDIKLTPDLQRIDLKTVKACRNKWIQTSGDDGEAGLSGMHPVFMVKLNAMAEDYYNLTHQALHFTSCWRSFKVQQDCWRKYGKGQAAEPGRSNHGFGLAVDFGRQAGWSAFDNNCRKGGTSGESFLSNHGFVRNLSNECWHFQMDRNGYKNYPAMVSDHTNHKSGTKTAAQYMTDAEKEPFKP